MNETFSASQAKKIASSADSIMDGCVQKIQEKSEQFAKDVSRVWEDKNAVSFFDELKNLLTQLGENIDRNHSIFVQTLVQIANNYARIGGMPNVSMTSKKLSISVDYGMVHETFINSPFPDSFGFNNVKTAPAIVMQAFNELHRELVSTVNSTVEAIKAIPAFGNQQVQRAIADSAGKIVSLITDAISRLKTDMQKAVNETAKAYVSVGVLSEQEAANIIKTPESPQNTSNSNNGNVEVQSVPLQTGDVTTGSMGSLDSLPNVPGTHTK